MKARQGRLAEAEAEARRALLARLKDQGKYSPTTPVFIMTLANVMVEQGRYSDAEKLIRVALEIYHAVGAPAESQGNVQMLSHLANVLTLQYKESEAAEAYAEADKAMANWEPARREALDLSGARILSLYASGQTARGVAAAEILVKKTAARLGGKAYETAAARGILAVGYMKAGRDNDAVREFRAAIPLLMSGAHHNQSRLYLQ
jgi:tetratricopeptide (TPR) repeat protein